MSLINFEIAPGIDKQNTTKGAENRWIDSTNVRFRYGLPEKIGGWSSLISDSIVGVVRAQKSFIDTTGNRYIALGTDKFLLLFFEGQLHDITPYDSTRQQTSATLATTDESTSVLITTGSAHGASVGDIIQLDSVTLPGGTGLSAANFEDKVYMINSVPSATTFTITSSAAATATISAGGSTTVEFYFVVGPQKQTYGYGWGVSTWGGTISDAATTTVNEALDNSETTITLSSGTAFPSAGTILIESELITYSGKSTNDLTGCTRGALGTTAVAHDNGTAVVNATDYNAWGDAVAAGQVNLEPGLWSLDNFGEVLVATVSNGKTFTWNPSATTPLTTRAALDTTNFLTGNNPTASRLTLISPTTRHLIHFGTENEIGDATTQDDMFVRFSEQEDINDYVPTSINSAGSQRLQDGTRIIGALKAKETILVWTDNAVYTMKFIGAPFTFGFEQVGTNCGLIGKNAAIEIDGVAFWMSSNGFFMFDGTVKSLPCSVEDYVYDQIDTTKGQQICAGINNLFTEVTWYYPSTNSEYNDQYVVFNYGEAMKGGVWYIGTEARTTWIDATIYPKPIATKFNSSNTGTFPTVIGEDGLGQTTLFEHEVGTDQINPDGSTTTVTSFVKSYDFDLQSKQKGPDGKASGPAISGETFLAVRRFVPDFKNLQGDAKITLGVKRYPQQSETTTALSPFTINSTTDKKDTRARGRFVNIKIENDGAGESWRFGTFRIDVQPDGRR